MASFAHKKDASADKRLKKQVKAEMKESLLGQDVDANKEQDYDSSGDDSLIDKRRYRMISSQSLRSQNGSSHKIKSEPLSRK